jgi:glycosyltransferase involved in cell wall biosynthesis
MTVDPTVSVIISCYNARDSIADAVHSALNQTYRFIEVIAVDDASTDDTPEQLRRLAAIDQRLRVVCLTRNVGPGGARNVGIEQATGEWLALLDADDMFTPNRIRALLAVAKAGNADLVGDNMLMEYDPSADQRTVAFDFGQLTEQTALTLQSFFASTTRAGGGPDFGYLKPLIKRAFLDDHGLTFSTRYRVGEDFLLFTECLLSGARFLLVPQPGYIYRRRKASITLSGRENMIVLAELNRKLMRRLDSHISNAAWHALAGRQQFLDRSVAFQHFMAALSARDLGQAVADLISSPYLVPMAFQRLRHWTRRGWSVRQFHRSVSMPQAPKLKPSPRVLIIVENLPVPFDRRVWAEATTLRNAGYGVVVICPKGRGYEKSEEIIEGISIYRHSLPLEASGAIGYLLEYASALFWQGILSLKVARRHGFDVIHACNPPDLVFLIGLAYKFFAGKSFVFDHHDINPEFYEAKFGRRDLFWRLLCAAERMSFNTADVCIATNESYRHIAIERGNIRPDRVFVVRSGPNLERVKTMPPDSHWRNNRRYVVGYVGVISETEGVDLLLEAVSHIVHGRGRTDIQFVVAGAGPQWPQAVALCRDMGLSDFVTFTGRVDDPTLFTILSTADVCVNSDRVTRYNDLSTMNKIMEYMTLGKPIVQFDLTEGRFSAQDASLYARANDPEDFAEKILALLADPVRRERMGLFGRRRVRQELAWNYEQPKLLQAYDTLFEIHKNRIPMAQRFADRLGRLASVVSSRSR